MWYTAVSYLFMHLRKAFLEDLRQENYTSKKKMKSAQKRRRLKSKCTLLLFAIIACIRHTCHKPKSLVIFLGRLEIITSAGIGPYFVITGGQVNFVKKTHHNLVDWKYVMVALENHNQKERRTVYELSPSHVNAAAFSRIPKKPTDSKFVWCGVVAWKVSSCRTIGHARKAIKSIKNTYFPRIFSENLNSDV